MLHSSVLAWLAVEKFGMGVPHHRLEQQLACEGVPLDRSVMCRNMEEIGSLLSATVVSAMLEHARTACQVLSTDATGAAIQPGPRGEGPKRPCKKGHFFTIVADCDHVLFEYASEHSSSVVAQLFKGFTGLLQSDASSVYDILERGPPGPTTKARRWSAAGRTAGATSSTPPSASTPSGSRACCVSARSTPPIRLWRSSPSERARRRLGAVKTLIDDFFAWVATEARKPSGRNLATKALGYALNQEHELRRVLVDGRLPLDNSRSERALRSIVVGRKAWLFYGSDAHANAAAAIFSLIASCRLHRLDPTAYLDDLLRVLPQWPQHRYLDLAPFRWQATRAQLIARELEEPLGHITVPAASALATP
ncbi:MAG: transposase [Polyangiaceae bacterium]|nr:transposase [Polyangiaceae bacterium]